MLPILSGLHLRKMNKKSEGFQFLATICVAAKRVSFATFNRNFLPCSSAQNKHIGFKRLCYVE